MAVEVCPHHTSPRTHPINHSEYHDWAIRELLWTKQGWVEHTVTDRARPQPPLGCALCHLRSNPLMDTCDASAQGDSDIMIQELYSELQRYRVRPSLHTLRIDRAGVTPKGAQMLARMITRFPIRSLSVYDNLITDVGMGALADAIRTGKTQLTYVDVCNTRVSDNGLERLFHALATRRNVVRTVIVTGLSATCAQEWMNQLDIQRLEISRCIPHATRKNTVPILVCHSVDVATSCKRIASLITDDRP